MHFRYFAIISYIIRCIVSNMIEIGPVVQEKVKMRNIYRQEVDGQMVNGQHAIRKAHLKIISSASYFLL